MIREIFRDQFTDVRRREWLPTLLMSAFFFLIIGIFWVLKPLKRGVIINYFGDAPVSFFGLTFGGAEAEQIGKFLNVIAAYLVVIAFTWLAVRVARHWMVAIFAAGCAAAFVSYAYLLQGPFGQLTAWSFYVFGDMFNTVMVVLFWAFTDDLWTADQAKRTYGLVGLGGTLGGFLGASVVSSTVEESGRSPLLLWCVVPMVLVVVIAFLVQRLRGPDGVRVRTGAAASWTDTPAAVEGAKLVFASPYLLAIAGIIGTYELVSNIVDFQLASTVEAMIPDDLGKDAFFALVGQITGVGSIVVQLLLTSFVMKRWGLKVALSFLPVAVAVSSLGFLILPTLALAAAMSASDNTLNYSINQSAREALYTPTDPDTTYKAKAFIDMFVQRFGKVVSVVLNLALVALLAGNVRWLSMVTLAMAVVWFLLVRYVGVCFSQAEREAEKREPGAAGPQPLPAPPGGPRPPFMGRPPARPQRARRGDLK